MKIGIPQDGWAGIIPRAWQDKAYPIILRHLSAENPSRAIVRAIMGSGKSIFMAQVAASCTLEPNEVIVVTAPTIRLVEQLARTFRMRLDGAGFSLSNSKVGCYYTNSKDVHTPVIITCSPSAPELARIVASHGKKCALWLPDECHRTSTPTIQEAYSTLDPKRVLGFSATPWRPKEEDRLHLFDKLIFDFGPKEAREAGRVVVPWRPVFWEGGETDLDSACMEMTELARGPGMYNATSIKDAEAFCLALNSHGIKAEAVHSRLKQEEIDRRIEALRQGDLSAIVHVNMLQEGVDLPWLCWLCMRRPVGSRVRFAQEIGRILRWCDEVIWGNITKTEAVIYDPHGLFGVMKLTYDAVLGGEFEVDEPDEPETEEDDAKRRQKILDQAVFDIMRHLTEVKAGKTPLSMSPLAGYLTELVTAFDTCGLVERKITGTKWRQNQSSEAQRKSCQSLKWTLGKKIVPKIHQKALGTLADLGPQMTRGMASDLLSIQFSLADKKKWPNFKELDMSAESSVAKHESRKNNPNNPLPRPAPMPPRPPTQTEKTKAELRKAAKEFEKKQPGLFE